MCDQDISVGGINANLAPDAFRRWASHYLKCYRDFSPPHVFSPVPYSLLCRAIELAIKSILLKSQTQDEVRGKYSHNIIKAYRALDEGNKILSDKELFTLRKANEIYYKKDCEYFHPEDTLNGFSRYPQLHDLEIITEKLVSHINK